MLRLDEQTYRGKKLQLRYASTLPNQPTTHKAIGCRDRGGRRRNANRGNRRQGMGHGKGHSRSGARRTL